MPPARFELKVPGLGISSFSASGRAIRLIRVANVNDAYASFLGPVGEEVQMRRIGCSVNHRIRMPAPPS